MSQRKRQHRNTTRTTVAHSPLPTVIHPDAADIVVGATELGHGGNGSSPAIANGRSFVRNFDYLYCIGET